MASQRASVSVLVSQREPSICREEPGIRAVTGCWNGGRERGWTRRRLGAIAGRAFESGHVAGVEGGGLSEELLQSDTLRHTVGYPAMAPSLCFTNQSAD